MISPNVKNCDFFSHAGDLLVVLNGRIVLEDCEVLRRTIIPRIPKGQGTTFVDLEGVEFIDSAGLGLLVGLKMTAKKNGSQVVLVKPSKVVSEILYISKLDGIFEFAAGEKATELRDRVKQPENRLSPNDSQFGNQSNFTIDSSSAFPNIGVDGNLSAAPVDKSSQEAVESYCKKAVEHMRQGDYEASIVEYKKALEIAPNYLPALNNLAIVYEKKPAWYPESIKCWQQVREISRANGDQKHEDRAERHLANLKQMLG